jgi:hypothetical protein
MQTDRQQYNLSSWLAKIADLAGKKKGQQAKKRIDIRTRRFNGIVNDKFTNIEGLRNKLEIMTSLTYLELRTYSALQEVGLWLYQLFHRDMQNC